MTDKRRRRGRRRPKVVLRAAADFVRQLKIKGTDNVDHQYVRNKSKETFISKVFKVQSAMTDKPKVDNFNGFSR